LKEFFIKYTRAEIEELAKYCPIVEEVLDLESQGSLTELDAMRLAVVAMHVCNAEMKEEIARLEKELEQKAAESYKILAALNDGQVN